MFREILLVPQNIVKDMNNVMCMCNSLKYWFKDPVP